MQASLVAIDCISSNEFIWGTCSTDTLPLQSTYYKLIIYIQILRISIANFSYHITKASLLFISTWISQHFSEFINPYKNGNSLLFQLQQSGDKKTLLEDMLTQSMFALNLAIELIQFNDFSKCVLCSTHIHGAFNDRSWLNNSSH